MPRMMIFIVNVNAKANTTEINIVIILVSFVVVVGFFFSILQLFHVFIFSSAIKYALKIINGVDTFRHN